MPHRTLSDSKGLATPSPRICKQRKIRRELTRAVAGVAAGLFAVVAPHSVRAATDYWDGDGLGAVAGGSGQWDAALRRWGASPVATSYGPFFPDDSAVFGGNGGTVNLTAAITGNLDVQSNGYLFQLVTGSGGAFSWSATAPTINVANGVSTEFRSALTSAASVGLTKTGGGTFGFSGALLGGSGPVNVLAGSLLYTRSTATIGSAFTVNISAGASLNLGKFNDTIGSLAGDGTIVLGANNNATNVNTPTPSSIWGSTLQVNADGGSSTFNGKIVDDGTSSPTLAPFSGGHFVKVGTGTLTLSGTGSTFHGATLVQAGALIVQGGSALPNAAPVTIAPGATFKLGGDEAIGSIGNPTAEASTASNGVLDVSGNTLTIGNDNLNNEFSGVVTGAGTIVKVGTGKQFFNSTPASTYTGKYVIKGGTFGFGNETRLGAVPAAPTPDYFTLDGGTLAPAILTAATAQTTGPNRGITITANGGAIAYNNPTGTTWTIQSPITGAGPLARSGPATIGLQGDNSTFSGKWTVTDGIINLGSSGAGGAYGTTAGLGNAPAGTGSWDISQARVQFATNASIVNGFQTYNVAGGAGSTFSYGPGVVATINRNGNNSLAVTIGDPAATSSTLIRKTNGTLLINVASGPLNLGASTGEQINFSGGVAKVVTNGGADTIVPAMVLTTSDTTTEGFFATYDNAFGVQVAPTSLKTDINTTDATDIYAADSTSTNALTATRSVYAVKIGSSNVAAVLALNGNTLHVGGATTTDPAMVILNTASTVTGTGGGTVDFANHEALIYTQGSAGTWTSAVTGSQGLTKMGYGTLTLAATTTLAYPGATRIEQGILSLGAANQLPVGTDLIFSGAPNTTAADNPQLALNGRTVTVNSVNSLNSAAGITTNAGGPIIALGTNGVLKITGSGTSVYNGQVTKAGTTSTIWNSGTGSLQLGMPDSIFSDRGAVMAYDKLWNTGGGTVILETSVDLNVFPASAGTVLADAYQLDGASTFRFPGIPGAGIGGDTSTLGGSLTINTGRGFRLGNGAGTTGSGTIQVDNPYEQISLGGAGGINGTGTLTKTGQGSLLLSSGGTAATSARWKLKVNAGVVVFQADDSVGPTPTTFQADNITLDTGGAIDVNNAGTITLSANRGITIGAGGGVIRQGRGQMNIAGPLVGTGPLRLDGTGTATQRIFSGISDGTAVGATGAYTGTVTLATDTPVYANVKNALGTGTITNDANIPAIFGTSFAGSVALSSSFAVNPGHTWDWSTANAASDLTLSGVISGSGAMYKGLNNTSPGILELANGANSFTGALTISQGTLVPLADGSLGATSASLVINGGNLALKGNLNYVSAKPLMLAGSALTNTSGNNSFAGLVTLTSNATATITAGSLTLTGGVVGASDSTLTKAATNLLSITSVRAGGLSITAGTVKLLPSGGVAAGVSNIRTLTIPTNSKLDLGDNKLVTANAVGTWTGSTYDGITGLIKSGRNGGGWAGATGIITSQSTAVAGNVTSIGVAGAAESRGIALTDTAIWAGQTVSGSDTLVMYTYGGDANLDGKINVDDYTRIDFNVSLGTKGWYNGDFNYDGIINVDDYTIIDFNVGIQGAPFFTTVGSGTGLQSASGLTGVTSVPEPMGMATVLVSAGLLRRRRRRTKRDA